MNTIGIVDAIWQDLKYGFRGLRLNPGFAAVAILSLALGIGANTAIFELIDAVRLRTLPVANPQDIALVRLKDRAGIPGASLSSYPVLTNPIWEQIRDAGLPHVDLFAWASWTFDLSENGRSRFTDAGLWVSGSYFPILGVQPVIGRLFDTTDDHRGCAPRAVISYAFWQRQFGGDPLVVGRPMSIDRGPVEILGVAEAGFPGLEVGRGFDVALPICANAATVPSAGSFLNGTIWWLTVMARLKPGQSIDSASAQLTAISPGIFEIVPPNYPPQTAARYKTLTLVAESAAHGVSRLRAQYADSLWILLAIAGAVLLIASANLANLMLARATARQREIAIRLAIGASRGRVVRQFLAESALLAAIGASLGAAIAGSLGRALIAFLGTDDSTVVLDLNLNGRVVAFTAATAAACAILFGLAPAIRCTRVAAGEALHPGGRGLTADRHGSLVHRALVVCQLALSLALVVCAFQFVTTFRTLATLDPGFRQDGIVEASIGFNRKGIPSDRRAQFLFDVLGRVRAVPGVKNAADTMLRPVSGVGVSHAVWLDRAARDADQTTNFNVVSDGYFSTLGIPIRAGRDFDPRFDRPASPKVAIVNDTFGRRFLKAGNPVGQSFWVERTPSLPRTRYDVIGVVNDTKYRQLRDDAPPIYYMSSQQITTLPVGGTNVLVRSDLPAGEVITSIERALASVDPDMDVSFDVLHTRIRQSLRREALMATLSGCFGALAALLATIGLYGVLSYTVARRRREVGIRMALGAARADIIAMIGREAGALVSVGIVLGSGLAVAASSAARTLLFGITPSDPASLLIASAGFTFIAALATAVPAVNASRLEPTIAIREE